LTTLNPDQVLLDRAADELEDSKESIRRQEEKHEAELCGVRDHFTMYRKAQESAAKSMERQFEALRADQAAAQAQAQARRSGTAAEGVGGSATTSTLPTDELADQLQRLEYKYKSKSNQLDAVMRSLAYLPEAYSTSALRPGSATGSLLSRSLDSAPSALGAPPPPPPPPSALEPLHLEMTEARASTAEREVESLQDMLGKERKNASALKIVIHRLKQETNSLQKRHSDKLLGSADPKESEFTQESEKVRILSKRLSETRKSAKSEISRLSARVDQLQTEVEAARAARQELLELHKLHDEARIQLQSMRDDSSRKAKLVATLKSAKSAEGSVSEQLRREKDELEEKVRRMGRAIASKDQMIKDMRAKQEAEEAEAAEASKELGLTAAASGAANPIATVAELRERLRSAELERARGRARTTQLKDKLGELEQELSLAKAENERLTRLAERADSLRAALGKKESNIRSQKLQMDKLTAEYEKLTEETDTKLGEYERRARNLKRQLEGAEATRLECERENEHLRRRLISANVKLGDDIGSREAQRVLLGTRDEELAALHRQPPPQQQHQQAFPSSQPQSQSYADLIGPSNLPPWAGGGPGRAQTPPRSSQQPPQRQAGGGVFGTEADLSPDVRRMMASLGMSADGPLEKAGSGSGSVSDGGGGVGGGTRTGSSLLGPSLHSPNLGASSHDDDEGRRRSAAEYSAHGDSSSTTSSVTDLSIEQRLKSLASAALDVPLERKL
jgi:chromosome segregation ATPase